MYCGTILEGKRRGALYFDEVCRKRVARTGMVQSTGKAKIAGTPDQMNEQPTAIETGM
jgi:hypothetical protein